MLRAEPTTTRAEIKHTHKLKPYYVHGWMDAWTQRHRRYHGHGRAAVPIQNPATLSLNTHTAPEICTTPTTSQKRSQIFVFKKVCLTYILEKY